YKIANFHIRFLMARLHLERVLAQLNVTKLRQTLSTLPSEYKDIYLDIMKRIRTHQTGERAALAKKVLTWLVHALRILTTEEIVHAVATEKGLDGLSEDDVYEAEQFVAVCLGLVEIDKHSGQIRLVHHTAQEFFAAPEHTMLLVAKE